MGPHFSTLTYFNLFGVLKYAVTSSMHVLKYAVSCFAVTYLLTWYPGLPGYP